MVGRQLFEKIMRFPLISQLLESTAITAGNLDSLAKTIHSDTLKNTKEWETINSKDSGFAKKLLIAWEGDARDYEKNRLGEPLFVKMIQPDSVKKLSNINIDNGIKEVLKKIDMLFYRAMPKHAAPVKQSQPNDVWAHVRHVREYLELREEVERILLE